MAIIDKHPILSLCAAVALSLTALQYTTIWWYSFPPKRPLGVPPDAVFIWAPGVGLPAPKRGDWVSCWYDGERNVDMCRWVDVEGELEYQGAFLPYHGKSPLPSGQLVIDARSTGTDTNQVDFVASSDESSRPGPMGVPPLHLRNGNVLIPARAYQAQKHALEEEEWEGTGRSPTRPGGVAPDATYVPWTLGDVYGMWLRCWLDTERKVDVCRAVATDGKLYYEGPYLPDSRPAPVPQTALMIDAKATWANKLDSSLILTRAEASSATAPPSLPFIYLRNGAILVPTLHYRAERKLVEKWRRMQPSLKRAERAWEKSTWW